MAGAWDFPLERSCEANYSIQPTAFAPCGPYRLGPIPTFPIVGTPVKGSKTFAAIASMFGTWQVNDRDLWGGMFAHAYVSTLRSVKFTLSESELLHEFCVRELPNLGI